MSITPTTLSFQDQLHLQNRLYAYEFGLEKIIELAQSNINTYEALGMEGTSAGAILKMALNVQAQVAAKP